jgi:hypothetical protein
MQARIFYQLMALCYDMLLREEAKRTEADPSIMICKLHDGDGKMLPSPGHNFQPDRPKNIFTTSVFQRLHMINIERIICVAKRKVLTWPPILSALPFFLRPYFEFVGISFCPPPPHRNSVCMQFFAVFHHTTQRKCIT